jgi:hypothetical protein
MNVKLAFIGICFSGVLGGMALVGLGYWVVMMIMGYFINRYGGEL